MSQGELRPCQYHVGAADRAAPALVLQPRVHALGVEAVPAPRQPPAPVSGLERLQAHRAVGGAAAGEEAVARKRSELVGGQALAVLRALLIGGNAGASPESPEDDEEQGEEHQRHAGRQDGDGERR